MKFNLIDLSVDLMETGNVISAADLRNKMAQAINLEITTKTLSNEWFELSRIAQQTWDSYKND